MIHFSPASVVVQFLPQWHASQISVCAINASPACCTDFQSLHPGSCWLQKPELSFPSQKSKPRPLALQTSTGTTKSGSSMYRGSYPTRTLAVISGSKFSFKITYCNRDWILKPFSFKLWTFFFLNFLERWQGFPPCFIVYWLQTAGRIDYLRIFHTVKTMVGANQTYYGRQLCALQTVLYIEFHF